MCFFCVLSCVLKPFTGVIKLFLCVIYLFLSVIQPIVMFKIKYSRLLIKILKVFQRLLFNSDRFNSENAINREICNSRPPGSIRTSKLPFLIRLKVRIIPLIIRTRPKTYLMHYYIIFIFLF
jgi:hypothetical protein